MTTVKTDNDVDPTRGHSKEPSRRRAFFRTKWPLRRWFRYGVLFCLAVSVIWSPVFWYIKYAPPTYKSQWSLLIPGAGVGSSVNLDNLGQTSTSVASPYASNSVDPKVNYKEIALSLRVRREAARLAGVDVKDYEKPKIKLVDQTAIMQAVFTGDTAEQAYLNSTSMYNALVVELDRLRGTERQRIEDANLDQLSEYEENASKAQRELLEYQSLTGIVSLEQFDQAIKNTDTLKRKRDDLRLKLTSLNSRKKALTESLGLHPVSAANVLKFQQDRQLQNHLDGYLTLSSSYLETASVLGSQHPKVRQARSRRNTAMATMKDRARLLLGYDDEEFIDRYISNRSQSSVNLFQEIISLHVEAISVEAEAAEIDALLMETERDIRLNAQQAATLQNFERNHQVANTIFLSALAKLDLGKSDFFASYPMTQLLVEPTLPAAPESTKKLFAILGALASSMFTALALVLLWKRHELRQLLLKKS